MEYLARAGELFSRHGAKLYLDQVLAKKQLLGACDSAPPASITNYRNGEQAVWSGVLHQVR